MKYDLVEGYAQLQLPASVAKLGLETLAKLLRYGINAIEIVGINRAWFWLC
ncbi:hypothetical protein FEAC_25830 [Ferrimicrobium acidiphilum DSM 19497]|uniref:Uncharacterized protein n=1 Tax=Ferrimicrobium acidiphilum DSM 19497 TaxID=1121877 RepID=A0A0D8FQX8_9ACTN|nr:hypothetical protein FEAC_25830 [Ferrimicrobium acidiphilum DSM 19497]